MNGYSYGIVPPDFHVGDRVQLHPFTDQWGNGSQFGKVTKVGRKYIHIAADDGRLIKISPYLLRTIGDNK